jgi:hypothetical protein
MRPNLALAAGGLLQLARDRIERGHVLALGVDLEQLQMDFIAARLILQRILSPVRSCRIL